MRISVMAFPPVHSPSTMLVGLPYVTIGKTMQMFHSMTFVSQVTFRVRVWWQLCYYHFMLHTVSLMILVLDLLQLYWFQTFRLETVRFFDWWSKVGTESRGCSNLHAKAFPSSYINKPRSGTTSPNSSTSKSTPFLTRKKIEWPSSPLRLLISLWTFRSYQSTDDPNYNQSSPT